jgi:hypothetical protein
MIAPLHHLTTGSQLQYSEHLQPCYTQGRSSLIDEYILSIVFIDLEKLIVCGKVFARGPSWTTPPTEDFLWQKQRYPTWKEWKSK